jgi:hypothetical protein
MAHHHSNLLLAVQRPKTLVARMGQRSLRVLHILQTRRGPHHAAVSALLEQDCFLGETWEVVVSGSKDQLEGISQERDSSGWKAPWVEL